MFWLPASNVGSLDEGQRVAIALVDGRTISRQELDERVTQTAQALQAMGERMLGFLHISNTLPALVAYLACLRAGHVPLLLPDSLNAGLVTGLRRQYQPEWVMGADCDGELLPGCELRMQTQRANGRQSSSALNTELGLLLSTSGTTGSVKLVRLSYSALLANARSIAQYLQLGKNDRALTVLPPYYSYGLSVINSHLLAGSTLVLGDVSVLSPTFAHTLREQRVSSISGVPYTYQMLYRTGFHKQDFPALRTLTQAGGRLDDRLTHVFAKTAEEKHWRFFVMYGQTEATARISYVPPEQLISKVGSIGRAIPDGRLTIDPHNGELIYAGPNVMMGYANSREDLARGDELHGILRTGDLARQDEDGYFYISGRLKRFVKLAGNRVSLDEVEQSLQDKLCAPVSVAGRDERLIAWLETQEPSAADSARQLLSGQYGLHNSLYRVRLVGQLPLLASGKKDYGALMEDL